MRGRHWGCGEGARSAAGSQEEDSAQAKVATGRAARRLSRADGDPGQLLTLLAGLWAGRKETLALGWGLWETPAEPRPQAVGPTGFFCEGAPAAWPGRSPYFGCGLGGLPEGRPGPPPCTALYPAGLRVGLRWLCSRGAARPSASGAHVCIQVEGPAGGSGSQVQRGARGQRAGRWGEAGTQVRLARQHHVGRWQEGPRGLGGFT